jgi:Icc-related predicted phosphoesterase
MKKRFSICIISDTHNMHKQLVLPDADMIIHCGDATSMGYEYELRNFFKWYSKLSQYKYKIFIAGNHDMLFENIPTLAKGLVPDNVIYLEDSGVEIDGFNFYGSPVQKPFGNWAFNREEEKLALHWEAIPDNTDVLITHGPPFGIMDWSNHSKSAEGSPSLLYEVLNRIMPKVHCFGHMHEYYGTEIINETTFINAAMLNDHYEVVHKPVLIEI